MDAVDTYIPDPVREGQALPHAHRRTSSPLPVVAPLLPVVQSAVPLKINSEVEIVGIRPIQKTTVTGIEMFHKQLDEAWAGENCGLLLRGLKRDDVERGQVVVGAGPITPTPSSRQTSTSSPRMRVAVTTPSLQLPSLSSTSVPH